MTGMPGTVIAHSPASGRAYIGSPSIVVLPDGDYLASHDYFGPGTNFDTVVVYGSSDRGATWEQRALIDGAFWNGLAVVDDDVVLMGTSRQFGDVVIRRSVDGGRTWTTPADESTGLLRTGRFHTAPTPLLEHNGRWWRAIEDVSDPYTWGRSFRAGLFSAPVGADLLRADSWVDTGFRAVDPTLLHGTMNAWLEGNAVPGPDGRMHVLMRVDEPAIERTWAALLDVVAPDQELAFDPESGLIPMPGGVSKFTVRWDEPSGRYHSLVNHVPADRLAANGPRGRHVLCHATSPDLRTWQVGEVVLEHPDDQHHGFQYVDWVVDGDDLLIASRTAHDDDHGGAANFHDSNYLTFHRLTGFRTR